MLYFQALLSLSLVMPQGIMEPDASVALPPQVPVALVCALQPATVARPHSMIQFFLRCSGQHFECDMDLQRYG
jgi:hypothetical protein